MRWPDRPALPRKRGDPHLVPIAARIVAGLELATLLLLAVVLAGCAGVPSSSAPGAIGTVERLAPSNLPEPTPGMDPDMLLREFL
jgi:hypothetical protein